MARRRDEQSDQNMVDVVLVPVWLDDGAGDDLLPIEAPDEAAPDEGSDTSPREPHGVAVRAPRGHAARHRRTTTIVAMIVVLGAGAATAVSTHRDDLRRERWAHQAEVMLPMDSAPVELWRLERETALVALGHGLYLTTTASGSLRAFDADTAELAWTAPEASVTTSRATEACLAVASEPPVFACRSGGEAAAALVVLDAATGGERSRRALPAQPTVFAAEGPDVILATTVAGGGLDVRREDVLTGGTRWEHRAQARPADADPGALVLSWGLVWRVADGALFVSGDPTLAIDLATGEILPWAEETGQVTTNVEALVDGGWATGPGIPTGQDGAAFEADGTPRFTFEGSPATLAVDDGSRPDLLLVRSWPRIDALDARTGETRWTSDDLCGGGTPAARLAGSLVCVRESGGEGMVGRVDLSTGEEVWRRPVGPVDGMSVATDGDRIVVLGGGTGRRAAQSFAWTDGKPGWESFVAQDVQYIRVVDRRLYGLGAGTLVRLG